MNDQQATTEITVSANDEGQPYKRPNIFIGGPSGTGKSTSLRNLDPARTLIIDTEHKALPFRDYLKFKRLKTVSSLAEFSYVFDRALAQADADQIVVESWTSIVEFAYKEIVGSITDNVKDASRKAWADYRDALHAILIKSKESRKFVIFTGIDEQVQDDRGRFLSTIGVQGQLKGKVEKEFVAVFWTHVADVDPLLNNSNENRYKFVTNNDGRNKAKTPMEMFDELYIDNDLERILRRMDDFYLGRELGPFNKLSAAKPGVSGQSAGFDQAPPVPAHAA